MDYLNSLNDEEKRKIYKPQEVNIRQCLGETVPTEIMRQIAHRIEACFFAKRCEALEINRIITECGLENRDKMNDFVRHNPLNLDVSSLMRITEL